MELLTEALLKDEFGLRERFPWYNIDPKMTDYIVSSSHMSYGEEVYLKDLMKPVFKTGAQTIERVENPYLWGRYVLQYEEMRAEPRTKHVKEQIMIHATSLSNAHSIAEENFDWRLVSRDRFGKGISFTNDPQYAVRHATSTSVFIVAGILVANSSRGYWGQEIPSDGEDTTTGFTKDVCIKYYNNDFYPYYIIQ